MKRLADRIGIVVDRKITLGEMLTLSVLLTVLAGGGYTLRSDIAQVRTDLSTEMDTRFDEMNRRVDEVNRRVDGLSQRVDSLSQRVDEVNRRVADLQGRMATVEAIVRIWAGRPTSDRSGAGDLSRAD